MNLAKFFPILSWGKGYKKSTFANDFVAALIVTIMLIPQSLAYAMLAGLPPQIGLYASILPLIAYAIFGSSRILAVGPVAVVSLMTAAAAGKLATQGSADYIYIAMILALLSGAILLIMGIFRLGFLANFLSHPVISGFITASGMIIAASQVKHILGVESGGHNLLEVMLNLFSQLGNINSPTLAIGIPALVFLFWVRQGLKPLLLKLGLPDFAATMISRAGPVFVVIAGISAVSYFGLHNEGVKIVGDIPRGLPNLTLPSLDLELWRSLFSSALLISIIGFVESVSVAQTLAAKKKQRIDPNQELIGLGAANLSAGFSGGYPVTGGFARSAVNFDAGAETPAAGAFTAIGIAIAALFLTPYLYYLPQAVLAATIIVAVIGLIDLRIILRTYYFSKTDFAAMATTILLTLIAGVETGVVAGVLLSLLLHLYNTSKPHFAVVGQVPGTHHFRNVNRHSVFVCPKLVTLRIDESLYFANARFLEDTVYKIISHRPDLEHLVLMCPAVNRIDASSMESLEAINQTLKDAGVFLHLSEVKGPVMDRLKKTEFLHHLSGNVYLHQFQATEDLAPSNSLTTEKCDVITTQPNSAQKPSLLIAGISAEG